MNSLETALACGMIVGNFAVIGGKFGLTAERPGFMKATDPFNTSETFNLQESPDVRAFGYMTTADGSAYQFFMNRATSPVSWSTTK